LGTNWKSNPRDLAVSKNRLARLSYEGSWIAAGQIASAAGMIVLVRSVTHLVDPAEYGQIALALAAGNLLSQTIMSVNVGIGRYYPVAAEAGDLSGYAEAIRALVFRLAAVCAVLTLALVGILYVFGFDSWIPIAIATAIYSISSGANGTSSAIQTAARQRKNVALHQCADAWLRVAAVSVTIPLFGPSGAAVITSYVVASVIVTISQGRFAGRLLGPPRHPHTSFAGQEWRTKILAFSSPFMLWGGFAWIQQASDRWALESFASTSEVGKLAVVFQLGYVPVTMLAAMVVSLIAPVLYQQAGDGRNESRNRNARTLVHRTMAAVLSGTVLSSVVCMFAHEWIFRLLVAESYRNLSSLLPWVMLAAGLFAAGQVLALDLMATMRTRELLWVKVSTSIFGTGCNFIGAWLNGTSGVVAGLLAFAVVYLAAVALLTRPGRKIEAQC
jgi:O-antigen/teichoic acid export membrane protein